MANVTWVTTGSKHCEFIGQDVEMREQRLYPAVELPDMPAAVVVKSRTCTAAIDCNLAGIPCLWAFNNPFTDRFPE
jgi:hypothetical protein